jgi:hypothetical protein
VKKNRIVLHVRRGLNILVAVSLLLGSLPSAVAAQDTTPSAPPAAVEMAVDPVTLLADGASQARLTVRVTDAQGNPAADGTEVQLKTTQGTLRPEIVQTREGGAEAWLTAGQTEGWAEISAVAGEAAGWISVWLVALPEDASPVSEPPASDEVPPFEPADAAERARHPVSQEPDGRLRGEGGGVTATFEAAGWRVSRNDEGQTQALAFELLAVRLGDQDLFVADAARQVSFGAEENRASRTLAEGLIESYWVTDDGVEQAFTLAQPPAVEGNLTVEGRFKTELKPHLVSSNAGIVFLDGQGKEVLAYGGAMACDALGRQAPVQMKLDGDQVILTLSGEWLAGAVYPVVVDPLIGDPILVSGAANDQKHPALAYNGDDDEWLTVWSDYRNGNWDIYGQRVQSNGSLAGGNFGVVVATGLQKYPDLAYNPDDDEYLVVWSDYRNNMWDIYGQRVLASGSLAGGNLALITATNAQLLPAVAYNTQADEYLAVWQDKRNGSNHRIYGQRVSGSGTLLGSSFAISDTTSEQQYPDVAYDSDTGAYLVVWQDDAGTSWDITARRVLSDGTPSGNVLTLSSANDEAQSPKATYNATDDEYLVVWQDDRDGNWNVYGQRVSGSGSLAGSNFQVSSLSGDETLPSIAWGQHSGRYLVGWQGLGLAQRVWADGTLDGGPLDTSSSANSPDHAYGDVSAIFLGVGEIYGDIYALRYGILAADSDLH